MSKLFTLREWFYIDDACRYLSELFNEPVTSRDLFGLALSEQLKLSVRFETGTNVRFATKLESRPTDQDYPSYISVGDVRQTYFSLEPVVTHLYDVFDLSMVGGERIYVRALEWKEDFDRNEFMSFDEVVLMTSDGRYCTPVAMYKGDKVTQPFDDPKNYHFRYDLPSDCRLVVRKSALKQLENQVVVNKTPIAVDESALSTTERNTLLKLTVGMAIKGYGYDPRASKSASPKEISDDLAELGIGVSDDTVRKYLRRAAETVLPGGIV